MLNVTDRGEQFDQNNGEFEFAYTTLGNPETSKHKRHAICMHVFDIWINYVIWALNPLETVALSDNLQSSLYVIVHFKMYSIQKKNGRKCHTLMYFFLLQIDFFIYLSILCLFRNWSKTKRLIMKGKKLNYIIHSLNALYINVNVRIWKWIELLVLQSDMVKF